MKQRMATILIAFGGLLLFWLLVVGYNLLSGPPTGLGIQDGRLADVPRSPNAVSSYATGEQYGIQPIPFSGDPKDVRSDIVQVLEQMPRSEIIEQQDLYVRAEFQSAFFRFVDDVEFLIDPSEEVVHFRSASRLGHSDLGVNRTRMEDFKERFQAIRNHTPKDD